MPYKDKDKNREYQRNWYYKFHEARLIVNRAKKQRYIKEGRCRSCGVQLIAGENKTCINCGGNAYRGYMYAKNCLQLAQNG